MFRVDGSLARKLDFGDAPGIPGVRPGSRGRLALLRGPDKYKVLERRRRAAQIKARHTLDLLDGLDQSKEQ
jgi:hypothetical protein